MKSRSFKISVLLPDIRSTHNVGSIFRTGDAVGVSNIYLSGYTPAPIDKFGRDRSDIAKTALGAEKTIPWVYEESVVKQINRLKKEGKLLIAVELSKTAEDFKLLPKIIKDFIKKKSTEDKEIVFVFGNEVEGLPTKLQKLCHHVVQIPMVGEKESLNVSVTAGIILFKAIESK
jgi:23S rRNA (guanosine2251-2'-O)-methyltransferase